MALSQTDFSPPLTTAVVSDTDNMLLDELISNTVKETIDAGVVLDFADVAEKIDDTIEKLMEAEIQKNIPTIIATVQTHLAATASAPSAQYAESFANMPALRKIDSIYFPKKAIKLINDLGINIAWLNNIMIKLPTPKFTRGGHGTKIRRLIWDNRFAFALSALMGKHSLRMSTFTNNASQYFIFNAAQCMIDGKYLYLDIISLTKNFPADKNPKEEWKKLITKFLDNAKSKKSEKHSDFTSVTSPTAPSTEAHLPRTTLSGEAPRRIYGGKTQRADDSSSSSSSSSDDQQNSKVFANMPVLRKMESVLFSAKQVKLINELGINTSWLKDIMIKLAFPQNRNIRERALHNRFIWDGSFAFALHTRRAPTVLTEFVNEVNQYFVFNSVCCRIENKKSFLNIISLTQYFPTDKNPEKEWDKLALQFLAKKGCFRSHPNESFHPTQCENQQHTAVPAIILQQAPNHLPIQNNTQPAQVASGLATMSLFSGTARAHHQITRTEISAAATPVPTPVPSPAGSSDS